MTLSRREALGLGAAAALSGVPRSAPAQATTYASGLPWRSGYRPPGSRVEALRSFEAWRGRRCDVTILFVGRESWQTWDTMAAAGALNNVGRAFHAAGYTLALSIPLLQWADRGNFALGARTAVAAHQAGHRQLAAKVAALVGGRRCYVRLGWEANRGYHWSYFRHDGAGPDPADKNDYRACWRNAALAWRAVCPSARFVWNHLKFADPRAEIITDYYPGDDAVDVLGIDPYDNGSWGYGDNAAGFASAILGHDGSFKGWDPATGRCRGLDGMRLFAQSRGKRISLCEWGPTNTALSADSRANNSYYVRAVFDFFRRHAATIEYETFFGSRAKHQIYPRVAYNAKPSDAYRAAYRP